MTGNRAFHMATTETVSTTSTGNSDAIYRIGHLAREFNVTLRTLRFYEDKGLLTPKRNGTTRLYSDDDRKRLMLILFSKNVGCSLVEIREILASYDANQHLRNPMCRSKDMFLEKLATMKIQKNKLEDAINNLSIELDSDDGLFAE